MPDQLPTVTVVMPVLNCVHFVAEALESVLAQTYPPLEIIVVDDGSTDRTSEVVSSFTDRGVQHIQRHDQRNLFSAFNHAIRMAHGDLIGFISGDDVWLPAKLSRQTALLTENPQFRYAITHTTYFIDSNFPPPPERLREAHAEVRQGQLLETVLARKTLFDEHGGFSEAYRISSDVEWFARMEARQVAYGVVPEVLVHKRLHSMNTSMVNPKQTQIELLRIMRDAVHERTRSKDSTDS